MRYDRIGYEVWEAFQQGRTLPVTPRPLISKAWTYSKQLNVDPERGADVVPLSQDELSYRRERCMDGAARSWVLAKLEQLGHDADEMMVVADRHGVVLWRGGHRATMKMADEVGFVNGACWDIAHAGANGISLSLLTGQMVTVCQAEHYLASNHSLTCAAIPVCDPRSGRVVCVLNLTGTHSTMHRAILRELDTIARQLRLQLRTPDPPRRAAGV